MPCSMARVFAVSGGVPSDHHAPAGRYCRRRTFGIPNCRLLRARRALVRGRLRAEEDRAPAAGSRRSAPTRWRRAPSGLRVRLHQMMAYVFAQLLYCLAGILIAGITREPTAFQGDTLAAAFGRRRRARRNVAARRPRLPDLDGDRRLLPQPIEPVRARSRRALLGSNHHPGLGPGFWHRRLLGPVDVKPDEKRLQ